MHQRPSRCCTCPNVSAATSDRRRPQPGRTASLIDAEKIPNRGVQSCGEPAAA